MRKLPFGVNAHWELPVDINEEDSGMLVNGLQIHERLVRGLNSTLKFEKALEDSKRELSSEQRGKLNTIINGYIKSIMEMQSDISDLVNALGGRIIFTTAKTNPFLAEMN